MSNTPDRAFLNHKTFPWPVFNVLAVLSVNFLFFHSYKSGTLSKLLKQCPASLHSAAKTQYALPPTGFDLPDRVACVVVTLFHSVLDSHSRPFMVYFLNSFSYISLIPSIEAARAHVPKKIAYPLVIGLLNQVAGVAVVLPIYFALLIHSGVANLHCRSEPHDYGKIDQANAEAILFGLLAGYILPTICLFTFNHPYATLAWQLAPVWIYLSQQAHLYIRPSSRHSSSGYRTMQATYLILCVLSAWPHFVHVLPRLVHDRASATRLFLPSLRTLDPAQTSLEAGVLDFLKWDAMLAFVASAVGCLWFSRDAREAALVAAWLVVGSLALGPGGAVALLWMWREKQLNGPRKSHQKKKL